MSTAAFQVFRTPPSQTHTHLLRSNVLHIHMAKRSRPLKIQKMPDLNPLLSYGTAILYITPHTYLLTLIREHDGSVRKRRLRALFLLTCDSKRSRSESSSEDSNTRTIFDMEDMTARGFKMSMRSAPLRRRPRPGFVSFRFVSRFHSGFYNLPVNST